MSTKHLIGSLLLLGPAVAFAQETKGVQTTGEVTVEGRKADVDPESAKFNEYSDVRNGFPRYGLALEVLDPGKGRFLEIRGNNLLRKDQDVYLSMGRFGLWQVALDRRETPHNLSFRAMTPFRNQGNGVYTLDSTAGIPNKNLAPTTAVPLLANDAVTGAWLPTQLQRTELGTQRDRTGATLSLTPTEHLAFRLVFTDERKEGTKLGYGTIGDRPPRSLNAQLALPVDFASRELKFETEYNRSRYQAMFTYAVSKFENGIDTFRWQNPYTTFTGTETFDQWSGHRVATFGQYALAPDSDYHHATLSLGVNLPWASRLTVSAAYGKMEQDQTLLPYATSSFNGTTTDFSSPASLPRATAEAEMTTKRVNVDYTISPLSRLNLRAYHRYYDLDNATPVSNWWYITSDTIPGGAAATVTNPTYKNQRRNVPYAYTQNITGLEATTYLPMGRTSISAGYEREDMDRTFRESTQTVEDTLKVSFRSRPASWLTLRGKALMGDRDGGFYDITVTQATYWYDPAGRDNDNPAAAFSNHPDMRKYDVSDRKRKEWELSAMVTPTEALSIALSFRDRRDDFDSDVVATQPLLGNPYAASDADRNAWTPGDQLGLLEHNSQRLALDVSYLLGERVTLNAFASREALDMTQRGLEFNENNRLNPTLASLATNELGSWTRRSSQWMSENEDETRTYGIGATFVLIPDRLTLTTGYTYSNGTVDIAYSGFGAVSAVDPTVTLPDNHQYAFRTPSTVRNRQTSVNAGLRYQITQALGVGVAYAYDQYKLSDWMQEANTPWFESVGSEYLLRDTSSATSTQWGNRLISLGSYLSPSYKAHHGSLSVHYRF